MITETLHPDGVLKFTPENLLRDPRGMIVEAFGASFPQIGNVAQFKHTTIFYQIPLSLRGMHFQLTNAARLIRCVQGDAFLAIVDAREKSPTLKTWMSSHLGAVKHEAVFVPEGFAVGVMALDRGAIWLESLTEEWDAEKERGWRWNDGSVGVKWPTMSGVKVSLKDQAAKNFSDDGLWDLECGGLERGAGGWAL